MCVCTHMVRDLCCCCRCGFITFINDDLNILIANSLIRADLCSSYRINGTGKLGCCCQQSSESGRFYTQSSEQTRFCDVPPDVHVVMRATVGEQTLRNLELTIFLPIELTRTHRCTMRTPVYNNLGGSRSLGSPRKRAQTCPRRIVGVRFILVVVARPPLVRANKP